MKSRTTCSIRGPGQRSIHSTFLFRPLSNCSSNYKKDSDVTPSLSKRSSGGRPHLSLSAFLDRKLHSSPVLPINKVERGNLSSSPLGLGDDNSKEFIARPHKERPCEGKRPTIEDSVFKLFNDKQGGKVGKASPQGLTSTEVAGRSEGNALNYSSKHHVLVIGDDPKPKRRAYADFANRSKKPRHYYNHYQNGSGWWDSEREGIDDDEVGSKEIWEAVGSTTLGGLEWN